MWEPHPAAYGGRPADPRAFRPDGIAATAGWPARTSRSAMIGAARRRSATRAATGRPAPLPRQTGALGADALGRDELGREARRAAPTGRPGPAATPRRAGSATMAERPTGSATGSRRSSAAGVIAGWRGGQIAAVAARPGDRRCWPSGRGPSVVGVAVAWSCVVGAAWPWPSGRSRVGPASSGCRSWRAGCGAGSAAAGRQCARCTRGHGHACRRRRRLADPA